LEIAKSINLQTISDTCVIARISYLDYRSAIPQAKLEVCASIPNGSISNIKEVFDFVAQKQESIGKYEDDDYTAMFLGLETALDTRTMGYEEKHTNFIILIGDAANRRTDPKGVKWQVHVDNLSQKMFNNRINFIAYQVNNAGSTAYDDFPFQVGKLQTELAKKLKETMIKEEMEYKLQTNRFYLLERKGNSADLPVYNTYKFATSGESETIEGLQNIIVDNISHFHNFVFDQLTLLEANYATASAGEKGTLVVERLQEILRSNR